MQWMYIKDKIKEMIGKHIPTRIIKCGGKRNVSNKCQTQWTHKKETCELGKDLEKTNTLMKMSIEHIVE